MSSLRAEAAADRGRAGCAPRSGGMPRIGGGLVAVHVGRLGAGVDLDAVADAPARSRPPARYRRARRSRSRTRPRPRRRAAPAPASTSPRRDAAADQHVAGTVRHGSAARRLPRGVDAGRGRQLLQATGKSVEVADGADALVADEAATASPRIAGLALGQRRLVVEAGDRRRSGCGRGCRRRSGRAATPGCAATQALRGRRSGSGARWCGERTARRTRRAGGQASAPKLSAPVDLRRRRRGGRGARRPRRRRRRRRRPRSRAGVEDGGDDLAVAGAAAEHAAERVHDLGLGRARRARQQGGRRHQHAGRADAALGGAVAQEGGLQARTAVGRPSPSTVVTRRPPRWRPAVRQAQTGLPSSSTVQAPQSPASQPTLVPVRPSSSRSTSASRRAGGRRQATAPAVQGEAERRAGAGSRAALAELPRDGAAHQRQSRPSLAVGGAGADVVDRRQRGGDVGGRDASRELASTGAPRERRSQAGRRGARPAQQAPTASAPRARGRRRRPRRAATMAIEITR